VWARAGRLRSVAAVVATVLLACHATGMAISYTVQVIAVSDQDSALGISRELLRDGYPAYVVRSTGAQGDVYRVRVGAFANRAAALRYSETMPDVAGSRPVPALAEAIPLGIMPLAPRLLWQHEWSGEDVWVLPWPAGVAVRVQPVDPLRQATYVVFQDGEERAFEAWAAVPLRELPDVLDRDLIDVPIIDLTEPEAGEPAADEPVANEPPGEPAADEPTSRRRSRPSMRRRPPTRSATSTWTPWPPIPTASSPRQGSRCCVTAGCGRRVGRRTATRCARASVPRW
jgi:hypothetical protein